jgi:ankyrin repeat protein
VAKMTQSQGRSTTNWHVYLLSWAALVLATATHAGQKEDQLVQAATDGDVATVKSLVRKSVNWNAREDPFGKTILHRIIEDLDARRRLGGLTDTELDQLQARQMEAVRLAIASGAKLELRDNNGATSLIDAAGSGGNATQSPTEIAAVKLLLEAGARVNAVDNNKCTALHMAAMRGYIESVKLLLDHGADPSLKNAYGETAANMAQPGDGHPPLDPKRRAAILQLLAKAKN